jgi:formate dehydrogenase major subunit
MTQPPHFTHPIAEACIAAYYPEASPLVPLWYLEAKSGTPGYKALPIRVKRAAA